MSKPEDAESSTKPPSSVRSLPASIAEDSVPSEEEMNGSPKPQSKHCLLADSDQSVISNLSAHPPHSARDLQHLKSNDNLGITFAGQDSLPRLPIPDLEETLEKFQYRLEALQDESQREETKRVVQEFLDGDGPKLQEALRQYEAEGIAEERIGVRCGSVILLLFSVVSKYYWRLFEWETTSSDIFSFLYLFSIRRVFFCVDFRLLGHGDYSLTIIMFALFHLKVVR